MAIKSILFCILLTVTLLAQAEAPPLIAVASNFRWVMLPLKQRFEQETGYKLRISYAASGVLAQQIGQGAPFELFISANPDYIESLSAKRVRKKQVLAYGQLALMLSHSVPSAIDSRLHGLEKASRSGQIRHIVIANPDYAPFGEAALAILQGLQDWLQIKEHLIHAENAAQTVHFIVSGAAQAGLVPYSLALNPALKTRVHTVLLAPTLQPDLPQTVALLSSAGDVATQFYRFLRSEVSQTLLRQHGFNVERATR